MRLSVLLATVTVAVIPMIAAGFLWPATWPMIWRQVAISLWGIGVIFAVERLAFGGPAGHALAALGALPPRGPVVRVTLVAAFAMFLGPPVLAVAAGTPWRLQPGWGLLLAGVILVNGLAEEVIHRSFLFRHLRARYSFPAAAAIAAAVFGAQHLYLVISIGAVAGIASVLLAVALTFPFVVFYERGGRSILPTTILHTSSNAPLQLLLAPTQQQAFILAHMIVVLAALYAGVLVLGRNARKVAG